MKKYLVFFLILACFLFSPLCNGNKESLLNVSFLDVGQGDATLIQQGNHFVLIDAGEKPNVIHSILENKGITDIEVVIATHNDSDHIGGIANVLKFRNVKKLYLSQDEKQNTRAYENMIYYANETNARIYYPKIGEKISIGDASLTFIGPIGTYNNSNDCSLCIRIDFGDTSFLLMGDSSIEVENEIIENDVQSVKCSVLKISHHGADTSTGYRLLRESQPQYAVISVGKNNSYGHPSEPVISRLSDYKKTNPNFRLYRTDMQGTVTFVSNGKEIIQVNIEKNEYSADVYKEKKTIF